MVERQIGSETGRSREEEYFRKKDRELIERMRQAAAAEARRQEVAKTQDELARKSGLQDPTLVQELQELGFTPETLSLLPLVPVLQMAWAEGGVSHAERDLLQRLARSRGIPQGSDADRQLEAWMAERPDNSVFARAARLIRAMLDSRSPETADLSADDLVDYCEQIAAASGGVFGIGRISAEERQLLSSIADDLRARAQ